MWPLNQNIREGLISMIVRLHAGATACTHVPEGQVLQFCPDFLSVEPYGVFLAHAVGDIETGSNQTNNVAIEEPSQELSKDLCTV